jgi:N-acetyl-gamma-glutamyl-phosphate reductase
MFKVYVDGQHGTTGLLVRERLLQHPKVQMLEIDYDSRHDVDVRQTLMNQADVVFLCLPDDAAKVSAEMIQNPNTCIIDASTTHRIDDAWAYGFPELSENHRNQIKLNKRVSNPGCHATAAIGLIYPLIQKGILKSEEYLSFYSITGYSGGGKQMIHTYETSHNMVYQAPRQYALNMNHKHVKEMMKQGGLVNKPLFTPIVSNYKRGLAVTIPLNKHSLIKDYTAEGLAEVYEAYYQGERFIRVYHGNSVEPLVDGAINIQGCNDTNRLDIMIYDNEDQIQLIARLDNLGKGASGAAIQNMNIMLGLDETLGLNVEA